MSVLLQAELLLEMQNSPVAVQHAGTEHPGKSGQDSPSHLV